MIKKIVICSVVAGLISACGTNPYKESNKKYEEQLQMLQQKLAEKERVALKKVETVTTLDTLYTKQINKLTDSISKISPTTLENIKTEWVGTVNFNLRKPNFVVIHHTAQDSLPQTIKTFTIERTQVSAHYVIADDGTVVHMLNDYLRAWHAGNAVWGRNSDINSASIGIELDNNGKEPFSEAQINSLLALLTKLKKDYNIPTQNFIGHSDIAPSRKVDPSALFPWQLLAEKGFGFWPEAPLEKAPTDFNAEMALKIIGYDTKNLNAAISAFKLHYIKTDLTPIIDQKTLDVLYAIYKKQP